MFLFGHLGIGKKLVHPWIKGLPLSGIFLGTLLPDLIDKPTYYLLSWLTHKQGQDLGIISGTRTFGHTGLFLLWITFAAWTKRSKGLAALSLGMATHLVLDSWGECFSTVPGEFPTILLWPLLGRNFPAYPFRDLWEHLSIWDRPFLLYTECAGALLLLQDLVDYRAEAIALFHRLFRIKPNR